MNTRSVTSSIFVAVLFSGVFPIGLSGAEAGVALRHQDVVRLPDGGVSGVLRLRWEERPFGKKWVLFNYDRSYAYNGAGYLFQGRKVLGQQDYLLFRITVAVEGEVKIFEEGGRSCVQGSIKVGGDDVYKRYRFAPNCAPIRPSN